MSKKQPGLEFVKHVPDFIAKMGLKQEQVRQHQEAQPKLADKFGKLEESKDDDYDYENALIDVGEGKLD
jgi:hypothetical protein